MRQEITDTITRSGKTYRLQGVGPCGPVYVWRDPDDQRPTLTRALVYIPGVTKSARQVEIDHLNNQVRRRSLVSSYNTAGFDYVSH